MLFALDDLGVRVRANEVEQRLEEYRCPQCDHRAYWVDGQIVAKHFRHAPAANCVLAEPEIMEHLQGKLVIESAVHQTDLGTPFIEHAVVIT